MQYLLSPPFLIICGIVVSFAAGVIASKKIQSITKRDLFFGTREKENDESFFKAIQYLISSNHEKAIEEFTKSVQVNPDVIETYVALGNLFRAKGDIGRAIRIRQSIILRHDIEKHVRLQALLDMGLDYRSGGFLDRALKAFLKVTKEDPSNIKALKEIKKIYEDMKEWERAYDVLKKISHLSKEDYSNILAHHLVEMGKEQIEAGNISKAVNLFNKAILTDEGCVDAYLHLGDIYIEEHKHKKAIKTWEKIAEVQPMYTYLAYERLEKTYSKMKNLQPVEAFLKKIIETHPDVFAYLALAQYYYANDKIEDAIVQIDKALEIDEYFWGARKLKGEILLKHGKDEEMLKDYAGLIGKLNFPYIDFTCSYCGFSPSELTWQCPRCKRWDTVQPIKPQMFKTKPSCSEREPFPVLKEFDKESSVHP